MYSPGSLEALPEQCSLGTTFPQELALEISVVLTETYCFPKLNGVGAYQFGAAALHQLDWHPYEEDKRKRSL